LRKIKIGLALLLLLIFAIAIAGCLESKSEPMSEQEKMADKIPPIPEETQKAPESAQLSSVATVKCELCHTNANKLNPHVNGGKLCINCHGSQLHNIHIGTGTVNLGCEPCHGNPPRVPKVEKGDGPGHYSVCEKCHAAPPNSLSASKGDLIVVHLSRSKYCTNCHGTDLALTHEAVLNKTNK